MRTWTGGDVAAVALALCVSVATGLALMDAPFGRLTRMEHQQQMQRAEVKKRFDEAVVMLHAKQHDHAIAALHRVLELSPRMPEAHVNMGFALLGLGKGDAALTFFQSALDLRPSLANAYYGLAIAYEQRGDYEMALGGMRSYLHLSKADDAYRAKARAALWEWEEMLGRSGRATAMRPAR